MAHTFCICWQTSTQRPQRMHLEGLRTIEGDESSIGRSSSCCSKGTSRMPNSAASVCSSQLRLRGHLRQSLGCVERIISRTVRRTSTISGSWVMIERPSPTGVVQARTILGEPSILTTQMPQAPHAGRSGCRHRRGTLTCASSAALRIVTFSGTWKGAPLILIVTVFVFTLCSLQLYLTSTASNLQTE